MKKDFTKKSLQQSPELQSDVQYKTLNIYGFSPIHVKM